ncbi:MAG: hypothetical protein KAR20_27670 [Candidatus Heimdallarchaeota archaeon]|nr:hypothetical protein [Candidatus Heimdallarchaeota archaeon]
MKYSKGDRVRLSMFGIGGFGGLSSLFLSEEGYFGQEIEITEVLDDHYFVILPSEQKLRINDRDILPA